MPANIRVNVDAKGANIQMAQTNQQINDQDKATKSIGTRIKENWVLASQVANATLSLAKQAADASGNVALIAGIQVAQTGLQIAQTEVGIYQLGIQALAAFALPGGVGIPSGIALTILAGILQGTVIASQINQAEQRNNQRNSNELKRQLESYL